jgi:hypothetical protein
MIARMIENAIIKGLDRLALLVHHDAPEKQDVVLLGKAAHPYNSGKWQDVSVDTICRLSHVYLIGRTGTGKTSLIQSIVQQDILAHRGLAVVDPHGDLTKNLLAYLAASYPSSQVDALGRQLVLIEPFDKEWSVAFNPLDAGEEPFAATLELVDIFRRFWGNGYWGPRMDELFRACLCTLCQSRLTLLEARPLMSEKAIRDSLVRNVTYSEVRDYWQRFDALSPAMQRTYCEPLLNRLSAFVSDPAVYHILGQRQSTFNFRSAFDDGKWILLNLAKGQVKENMKLLGSLFLAKMKQAALSRADTPEADRRPFFVVIDEFQNFTGEDIDTMLSELRKYRVSLTLAHQTLAQLPATLRAVVLANTATGVFFGTSHYDAAQLSSEIDQREKHAVERRLVDDFKVGQAYLKCKGQKARLLRTTWVTPSCAREEDIQAVRRASFECWARPIREVEMEISERRNVWSRRASSAVPEQGGFPKTGVPGDWPLPADTFEEGQSDW